MKTVSANDNITIQYDRDVYALFEHALCFLSRVVEKKEILGFGLELDTETWFKSNLADLLDSSLNGVKRFFRWKNCEKGVPALAGMNIKIEHQLLCLN